LLPFPLGCEKQRKEGKEEKKGKTFREKISTGPDEFLQEVQRSGRLPFLRLPLSSTRKTRDALVKMN
jgi:hypothetical protein